jgi:hypothetical protein
MATTLVVLQERVQPLTWLALLLLVLLLLHGHALLCSWGDYWKPPQTLLNLTDAGFDLLWLPDGFTRGWTESRSMVEPLPTLRIITPHNLAYDMWDAHAHR